MSNKQCRETKWGADKITDFMICAEGGKGKAVYHGDSGGSLAVKGEDGKYSLVGIISFGDFFTRVTAFTEWIKNNVECAALLNCQD